MNLMGLFRSPQNELEKGGIKPGSEETGINNTCPHCGALLPISETVCPAAIVKKPRFQP